ncbi:MULTISPECIES: hypothetical protein [Bradyrhizobium]|uniref:hypothetical protein n=1 Tax=Bradyrhizobium TaxID=374 RepID=UPI0012FD2A18|nr:MULTISPECIES: hypothetical protein [Bradyrhizobium]MCA1477608.1 hypothetical protein [Bradyrhizobium sp. NBAIM08]
MLIDDVEGRRRWRRAKTFQFPCQLRAYGKHWDFRMLFVLPELFAGLFRTQNLRFAQSLCDAQGLSLMSINWARADLA